MLNILSRQRPMLYFFILVGAMTLLVMLHVELPLLLGLNPDWERKIDEYRWLLHIHAFFGSIALFSAPVQFFTQFRKKHLRFHRYLGRIYAMSILVSAPIGIYIALMHLGGYEKWAATAQGLLWMGTTLVAVYTAINKQLAMHQIWIARSYALTLTFVLSRFIVDVLKWEISPTIGGGGGLILISTFLAFYIADTAAPEVKF